jgi:hypothetical protein
VPPLAGAIVSFIGPASPSAAAAGRPALLLMAADVPALPLLDAGLPAEPVSVDPAAPLVAAGLVLGLLVAVAVIAAAAVGALDTLLLEVVSGDCDWGWLLQQQNNNAPTI